MLENQSLESEVALIGYCVFFFKCKMFVAMEIVVEQEQEIYRNLMKKI